MDLRTWEGVGRAIEGLREGGMWGYLHAVNPFSPLIDGGLAAYGAAMTGDYPKVAEIVTPLVLTAVAGVIAGKVIGAVEGAAAEGGGSQMVNPRSLRPTHLVDSRGKVDRLAKAMRKDGFDAAKPLDAVEIDGALYIADGHHRAAAAARAGIGEVPARVRPPHTPAEAIQLFRDFAGTLDDRGF